MTAPGRSLHFSSQGAAGSGPWRDPKGNVIFPTINFQVLTRCQFQGAHFFKKCHGIYNWIHLFWPVSFVMRSWRVNAKPANKSQSFYDKKRCRCNHSQGKSFCPDMGCAWNLSKIQKGATLRARLKKQKYCATISESKSAKTPKSPSYWYTWSHFSPAKYSVRTCFGSNLFLGSVSVGVDLCIY